MRLAYTIYPVLYSCDKNLTNYPKIIIHKPTKLIFFQETLLLIGRKGSGLDQVAKTLHYKFGVFVLYENLDQVTNAKEILYSLTNLSNCVIINHGDNLHANMETSALKFNSLLLEACDDKCLTSPSLWTQLCQYFNGKALAFDNVRLADIKDAINERKSGSMNLTTVNFIFNL